MKIDTRTYLIVLILGIIWGSNFKLMKIGLESFTPIQVASLRIVFAGSVSSFFFFKFFKNIKKRDWLILILSGTIGNLIPAFIFAKAVEEMPSAYSGALNALTPFFTLTFGVLVFSQKFNIRQFIGILMGLIGALSLIFTINKSGHVEFMNDFILPSIKVIFAVMLYGINVNIIKSKLGHLSSLETSMIPLTLIAIPALIIGISNGVPEAVSNPANLKTLGYIFILGVIGTAASLIVFNQLVRNSTALFASSVTYLIPVFAFMWGIKDGEQIGLFQIFGIALILGGITLTKR